MKTSTRVLCPLALFCWIGITISTTDPDNNSYEDNEEAEDYWENAMTSMLQNITNENDMHHLLHFWQRIRNSSNENVENARHSTNHTTADSPSEGNEDEQPAFNQILGNYLHNNVFGPSNYTLGHLLNENLENATDDTDYSNEDSSNESNENAGNENNEIHVNSCSYGNDISCFGAFDANSFTSITTPTSSGFNNAHESTSSNENSSQVVITEKSAVEATTELTDTSPSINVFPTHNTQQSLPTTDSFHTTTFSLNESPTVLIHDSTLRVNLQVDSFHSSSELTPSLFRLNDGGLSTFPLSDFPISHQLEISQAHEQISYITSQSVFSVNFSTAVGDSFADLDSRMYHQNIFEDFSVEGTYDTTSTSTVALTNSQVQFIFQEVYLESSEFFHEVSHLGTTIHATGGVMNSVHGVKSNSVHLTSSQESEQHSTSSSSILNPSSSLSTESYMASESDGPEAEYVTSSEHLLTSLVWPYFTIQSTPTSAIETLSVSLETITNQPIESRDERTFSQKQVEHEAGLSIFSTFARYSSHDTVEEPIGSVKEPTVSVESTIGSVQVSAFFEVSSSGSVEISSGSVQVPISSEEVRTDSVEKPTSIVEVLISSVEEPINNSQDITISPTRTFGDTSIQTDYPNVEPSGDTVSIVSSTSLVCDHCSFHLRPVGSKLDSTMSEVPLRRSHLDLDYVFSTTDLTPSLFSPSNMAELQLNLAPQSDISISSRYQPTYSTEVDGLSSSGVQLSSSQTENITTHFLDTLRPTEVLSSNVAVHITDVLSHFYIFSTLKVPFSLGKISTFDSDSSLDVPQTKEVYTIHDTINALDTYILHSHFAQVSLEVLLSYDTRDGVETRSYIRHTLDVIATYDHSNIMEEYTTYDEQHPQETYTTYDEQHTQETYTTYDSLNKLGPYTAYDSLNTLATYTTYDSLKTLGTYTTYDTLHTLKTYSIHDTLHDISHDLETNTTHDIMHTLDAYTARDILITQTFYTTYGILHIQDLYTTHDTPHRLESYTTHDTHHTIEPPHPSQDTMNSHRFSRISLTHHTPPSYETTPLPHTHTPSTQTLTFFQDQWTTPQSTELLSKVYSQLPLYSSASSFMSFATEAPELSSISSIPHTVQSASTISEYPMPSNLGTSEDYVFIPTTTTTTDSSRHKHRTLLRSDFLNITSHSFPIASLVSTQVKSSQTFSTFSSSFSKLSSIAQSEETQSSIIQPQSSITAYTTTTIQSTQSDFTLIFTFYGECTRATQKIFLNIKILLWIRNVSRVDSNSIIKIGPIQCSPNNFHVTFINVDKDMIFRNLNKTFSVENSLLILRTNELIWNVTGYKEMFYIQGKEDEVKMSDSDLFVIVIASCICSVLILAGLFMFAREIYHSKITERFNCAASHKLSRKSETVALTTMCKQNADEVNVEMNEKRYANEAFYDQNMDEEYSTIATEQKTSFPSSENNSPNTKRDSGISLNDQNIYKSRKSSASSANGQTSGTDTHESPGYGLIIGLMGYTKRLERQQQLKNQRAKQLKEQQEQQLKDQQQLEQQQHRLEQQEQNQGMQLYEDNSYYAIPQKRTKLFKNTGRPGTDIPRRSAGLVTKYSPPEPTIMEDLPLPPPRHHRSFPKRKSVSSSKEELTPKDNASSLESREESGVENPLIFDETRKIIVDKSLMCHF